MAIYKRGDLVWAKMKGFPPWPGIIAAPPPELKKQPCKKATLYHCIFFFGTQNYSWIESHKLEKYKKGSGGGSGKKSTALRDACTAIEAYIETGEGASNFNITPEDDAFDKLVSQTKAEEASTIKKTNKDEDSSTTDDDDDSSASSDESEDSVVLPPKVETEKQEAKKSVDSPKDSTKTTAPLASDTTEPNSSNNEIITIEDEEFGTPPPNNNATDKVEDPLKVDSKELEDNSYQSTNNAISVNTATQPTNTDFKPSTTKLTQSGKKKFQQIVKARPFRQLPKPRVVDRRTPTTTSDSRGSSSTKLSGIKRNFPSSSNPDTSSTSTSSAQQESKKKKRQEYSEANVTTPVLHPHAHSYARRGPAAHLFDRPPNITRPETPPLDLFTVSQTLLDKHITPSPLRFGFLGLGIMGSGMVKNLLNSGHRVIVWNRSPEKSREFARVGAEMAVTPQDVCAAADITFSCVSGPKAAKDMVFGNCGALREMNPSKSYVEMTNIDKETSLDIAEAITSRGARYLEAQIQGSKAEAEEGSLVILTAGDRALYNECHSCFEAFGRSSFFLGEVGNASKMNLVIQMVSGITLAGLAEGLALADRCGLQQSDILEVISQTALSCPLIADKGKCITKCSFPTSLALSHLQKDLKLGLKLADELEQPVPLTAAANEVYKHSKRLGYGDHDASAVYIRARF